MFVELGIFDKRIVAPDRRRFALRKVVFMTIATVATRCTVTRRQAVFMRRMFGGGKGSATFAFASVITTVVNARARLVFRIVGFMTIATADARRAGAGRRTVFMLRVRRGGKVGAFFALASMVTTVVSARARLFFRIVGFVAIATLFAVGFVARRQAVFMLRMFLGGKTGAFFALASMITTVLGARARLVFRVLRIVGFVAVATVFAVGLVATGFAVFVSAVRFAGQVSAALALMQTTVVAASASFVEFMTLASVGRFIANRAAPLTANALATTTRATFAIRIGSGNVVKPRRNIAASNPLGKVANAAAVRVVSFEFIESFVIVKRRYNAIGNRQILGNDNEITEVGHKRRCDAAIEIGDVRIAVKRYALQFSIDDTKVNRPISRGDVYGSNSAGRRPIPVT